LLSFHFHSFAGIFSALATKLASFRTKTASLRIPFPSLEMKLILLFHVLRPPRETIWFETIADHKRPVSAYGDYEQLVDGIENSAIMATRASFSSASHSIISITLTPGNNLFIPVF
jgi:hypothetical protein